ncbi:FMN-binding protein [Streptomyces deserti]
MPALARPITAALGFALACTLAGCTSSQSGRDTRATPPTSTAATTMKYTDGDYQATGWYGGQPSRITVNVTLDEDTITRVRVTTHATDPTSLDYQKRFAKAVPGIVTGKKIDDIELDRVAGSSSTPDGFNDALDRIKSEARS